MRKIRTGVLCAILALAIAGGAIAATVTDFHDVASGIWYYDSVKFVTDKGMFNGTSATTFSPNQTMTRGMFCTVLGRYGRAVAPSGDTGVISADIVNLRSGPSTNTTVVANLKRGTALPVTGKVEDSDGLKYIWYKVSYNGSDAYVREDLLAISDTAFTDVNDGLYYAPYVRWCVDKGIAPASGDKFYPENPITREDICLFLANYASFKHLQLNPYNSTAAAFTDLSSVTAANRSAVTLLQQMGIITGYEDNSFKPKNSATRAEVATLLMRFVDAVSYFPIIESPYDQAGNYIFGRELPESAAVSAGYFDDACFIGHSIVVGMKNYFGLANADFYAVNGASCRYFLNDSYKGFPLADGSTGGLAAALSENRYGKVYIMLGTNELGSTPTTFKANLSSIVSLVRQSQPNAAIYLYSVTPVTQDCSEASASFNRDNIIAFNEATKTLCAEQRCYYLNVFDRLVDADGYLPSSNALSDGIHLIGSQYTIMKSYTLTHTA